MQDEAAWDQAAWDEAVWAKAAQDEAAQERTKTTRRYRNSSRSSRLRRSDRAALFRASLCAFRCRHGGRGCAAFLRAHGGEAGEALVFHRAKPWWVLALKYQKCLVLLFA